MRILITYLLLKYSRFSAGKQRAIFQIYCVQFGKKAQFDKHSGSTQCRELTQWGRSCWFWPGQHIIGSALLWRHNGRAGVSNQPRNCLLNRLFRCRSKKRWKLRVTGLCAGHSPSNSGHKWSITRKCFQLMTSSWMNWMSLLIMFVYRPRTQWKY